MNPLTLGWVRSRPLHPFNFWLLLSLDGLVGGWAAALWLLRRWPTRQVGLCVSAGTLALALLVVDLGLSALRTERISVFCANPAGTGSYRLRPNLHLTSRNGTVIETNAQGMRWPEVQESPPPGERRVAFLGDSFTFGDSADRVENALVGVFERLGRPHGVAALNFGVGGYGIDDSELLLRERVWGFSPQTVVAVLFMGNDFRDTYLGLHKFAFDSDFNTTGWHQPEFDTKVPAEYRAPGNVGKWLHEHSSLYALLKNASRGRGSSGPKVGLEPFRLGSTFTLYTFWSRRPYPPVAQASMDCSLASLAAMRDQCRQHGADFLVVLIPFREQVYASELIGPGFDVHYPQQLVVEWAGHEDVGVLDLFPLLREYVLAHAGEELYATEHLNNAGHALAGQWIWDFYQRFERDKGKGRELHAP